MSKLETIEAEVRKLPREQAMQLQDWLANYLEGETASALEPCAQLEFRSTVLPRVRTNQNETAHSPR